MARAIVNTLIVGVLSQQVRKRHMVIEGIENNGLKENIKTFRFKEKTIQTANATINSNDDNYHYQQLSETPLIEKHPCSLNDIS